MFSNVAQSKESIRTSALRKVAMLTELVTNSEIPYTTAVDATADRIIVTALNEHRTGIQTILRNNPKPASMRYTDFFDQNINQILDLILSSQAFAMPGLSAHHVVSALGDRAHSWRHLFRIYDEARQEVKDGSLQPHDLTKEFQAAIKNISDDSRRCYESMQAAQALAGKILLCADPLFIFTAVSEFRPFQFFDGVIDTSSAITGSAMDFFRTRQFLLAIQQAVKVLEQRFPEGPLKIVDAGSGPLGLLGLMALASSTRTEVTFLEAHPSSAALLTSIITKLGLGSRVQIESIDAFTWAPSDSYHAVISETLNSALSEEPFPLLIQHLRQYLQPGGIILPQGVKVALLAIEENIKNVTWIKKLGLPMGIPVNLLDDRHTVDSFYFNSYTSTGKEMVFCVANEKLSKNTSYTFNLQTTVEVDEAHHIVPGQSLITARRPLYPGRLELTSTDLTSVYMSPSRRERTSGFSLALSLGTPNLAVNIKNY